ncbi:MAG TPA: ParB/RepB/Spo0J family partition protein [Gemmatimonadaceae bacterium]|nr:ParB/RepB/Spo0J family partition protein [Gemmatimonadaceae bacterium]
MTPEKPRRLGRGLEALLAASPTASSRFDGATVQRIALTQIRPNPYQPRREFKAEELADLEVSLRANGLLQPISVRPAQAGAGFELIAGERRLRAAARLGWPDIPATVRDVDDRTLLTLALVENLQRADLNAVEEAEGYHRLTEEFGLTQQEVADIVGKDRSTVANALRLLQLPDLLRQLLQDGRLSAGHARALLGLDDETRMIDLGREVAEHGLSVREVERRVREGHGATRTPKGGATGTGELRRPVHPEVRRLEDQLRRHLQTDVQIVLAGKDKGSVRIAFYSADDLERVLDLILGAAREVL